MSLSREQIKELGRYFRSKVEDVQENLVNDHITLENGEEYEVYPDYDSAEAVALQSLKDSLEDNIDLSNPASVEDYVVMPDSDKQTYAFNDADDHLNAMSEEDVFELAGMRNHGNIENELDELKQQLSEEESPEQEKDLYEQIKRLKEKLKNSGDSDAAYKKAHNILYRQTLEALDNPIYYFAHELGYDLNYLIKNGTLSIDWTSMAEGIINSQGIGQELASYDGSSHVINGMWAFRTD